MASGGVADTVVGDAGAGGGDVEAHEPRGGPPVPVPHRAETGDAPAGDVRDLEAATAEPGQDIATFFAEMYNEERLMGMHQMCMHELGQNIAFWDEFVFCCC